MRKEAEAKAQREWMASEERVRREAHESGIRQGEERARLEAAAAQRREAALRQAELVSDMTGPARVVWEAAHAGDAVKLQELLRSVRLDTITAQWLDASPLHAASTAGHTECVQHLCGAGCAIDVRNAGGRTPLFAACVSGKLECAVLLIRLGASVDATDHWGSTPLIAAASEGHARLVQLCIEHSADVHARGPHGTCLEVARAAGHDECTDLILQHHAVLKATGGS